MVGASTIALGTMFSMAAPAEAGTCDVDPQDASVYICSGAAVAGDSTEAITVPANSSVTLREDGTFGLNVASGIGIEIFGGSTTTSITIDLDGDIQAQQDAFAITHNGSGALTITTDGAVTSNLNSAFYLQPDPSTTNVSVTANGNLMSRDETIDVQHQGTGTVTIETGGTVTSTSDKGIFVNTVAATAGIIEVTARGNIQAQLEGINIDQNGTAAVNVTTQAVTSTAEEGIFVETVAATTGDVTVTASGAVSGAKDGIFVNHLGSGNVAVTVNADVTAGGSNQAIDIDTAEGDATITVGMGATLTGGMDISGVSGTTDLEFAGSGSGSFDFSQVTEGFRNFEKNGPGTLTITGSSTSSGLANTAAFSTSSFNAGTVIFNDGDSSV